MGGCPKHRFNKEITLGLKIRFKSSLPIAAVKEDKTKQNPNVF